MDGKKNSQDSSENFADNLFEFSIESRIKDEVEDVWGTNDVNVSYAIWSSFLKAVFWDSAILRSKIID